MDDGHALWVWDVELVAALNLASPVLSIGKEESLGGRGQVGQAGVVDVVWLLKCSEVPVDMCNVYSPPQARACAPWHWGVSLVAQLCQ